MNGAVAWQLPGVIYSCVCVCKLQWSWTASKSPVLMTASRHATPSVNCWPGLSIFYWMDCLSVVDKQVTVTVYWFTLNWWRACQSSLFMCYLSHSVLYISSVCASLIALL